MADRPCEKGLHCSFEYYDYSEDCVACGIDFDGDACPYVKPWGKKKWRKEQEKGETMDDKERWSCLKELVTSIKENTMDFGIFNTCLKILAEMERMESE